MVTGIEHFAIISEDTKRLSDWYKRVFNLECVYDNGKGTYFLAFPDKSLIEFITATDSAPKPQEKLAGVRHIAFTTDNFAETVELLKKEGVEIIHDAATSAKGISTFFFRDIDGNVMHLIDRPTPLV